MLLFNDMAALASINQVLEELGCAPVTRLADLFEIAEPALLTFSELDHHPQRGPARYWGIAPSMAGEEPRWPAAPGPKVFAYVRPAGKHYGAVLEALGQLPASVLVVVPGLAPSEMERLQRPSMRAIGSPVDLRQAAQQADLGVMWSGGGNTTLAFLLAGTPVVLLPNQIEPFMQGLRVQQLGAGLVADLDTSLDAWPELLARGLMDEKSGSGVCASIPRGVGGAASAEHGPAAGRGG